MCISTVSQLPRSGPPQGDSKPKANTEVSGEPPKPGCCVLCSMRISSVLRLKFPGIDLCMFCAAGYRVQGVSK